VRKIPRYSVSNGIFGGKLKDGKVIHSVEGVKS